MDTLQTAGSSKDSHKQDLDSSHGLDTYRGDSKSIRTCCYVTQLGHCFHDDSCFDMRTTAS